MRSVSIVLAATAIVFAVGCSKGQTATYGQSNPEDRQSFKDQQSAIKQEERDRVAEMIKAAPQAGITPDMSEKEAQKQFDAFAAKQAEMDQNRVADKAFQTKG